MSAAAGGGATSTAATNGSGASNDSQQSENAAHHEAPTLGLPATFDRPHGMAWRDATSNFTEKKHLSLAGATPVGEQEFEVWQFTQRDLEATVRGTTLVFRCAPTNPRARDFVYFEHREIRNRECATHQLRIAEISGEAGGDDDDHGAFCVLTFGRTSTHGNHGSVDSATRAFNETAGGQAAVVSLLAELAAQERMSPVEFAECLPEVFGAPLISHRLV